MRKDVYLQQLAREAGISLPNPEPALSRSVAPPIWSSAKDNLEARLLLTDQRVNDPSYKDPFKQKRKIFRSKTKNEQLADPRTWNFSSNELAAALGATVGNFGPVGVAQALLDIEGANVNVMIGPQDSEDWYQRKKSLIQGDFTEITSNWLEQATASNALEHVRLLASRGSSQDLLDRALLVALRQRFDGCARELLRYGANPNTVLGCFQSAIQAGDITLIKLYLSSPSPIQPDLLGQGLADAVIIGSYDIVRLLLAHGADRNFHNSKCLVSAVASQNLKLIIALLIKDPHQIHPANFVRAIDAAGKINNLSIKLQILDFLLSAGAPANSASLQNELSRSVKQNSLEVGSLIISHGTSVERNDAELVVWAVENVRFDVLEVLLQGDITSTSASRAVDQIPDHASEADAERLVVLLSSKGAGADSLGRCLERAIAKNHSSLAQRLVDLGAPVDNNNGAALQLAIKNVNFVVLRKLLQAQCSPDALANAIPCAVTISSKPDRHQAALLLLEKGASGEPLNLALQNAVTQPPDDRDGEFVDLLLNNGASVDYSNATGNCVRFAASQGDLLLLEQLCRARPSQVTAAAAVPFAFHSNHLKPYADVVKMITLLLRHGAQGPPVATTLLRAIQEDRELQIVKVLLEHGADVNYQNGAAIEAALKLEGAAALQLICDLAFIEKEMLEKFVPIALEPENYDPVKAKLLLERSRKHRSILNNALVDDGLKRHASRREVIGMLLGLGADADFEDGSCIEQAVTLGETEFIQDLVSRGPVKSSLRTALLATSKLQDKQRKFEIMKIILGTGHTDIGQNECLALQTANVCDDDDLRNIQLLLDHGATVDFQDGVALQTAITLKNTDLLRLLLSKTPNEVSLPQAFFTARRLECEVDHRLAIFDAILKSGYKGTQTSDALVEAILRDPIELKIPRQLLTYGASVNYEDGRPLQLASKIPSLHLLRLFMVNTPNSTSVRNAFREARQASMSPQERIDIFNCLLQFGPHGALLDQVGEALIEAVERDSTELELPRMLIAQGASVDMRKARCIEIASREGNVGLLTLLLNGTPNRPSKPRPYSLEMGFDAARRSNFPDQQRLLIYELLLKAGVRGEQVSAALKDAIHAASSEPRLLQLLLQYDASFDLRSPEALYAAVEVGNLETLNVLLGGPRALPDTETMDRAFDRCFNLDPKERYQIANRLLSTNVISIGALSTSLDRAVQDGDHELLSLILSKGADPSHNASCSLISAVKAADPVSTKLLVERGVPADARNKALQMLLQGQGFSASPGAIGVMEILLDQDISSEIVNETLLQVLQKSPHAVSEDLIQAFLRRGANANMAGGACFLAAAYCSPLIFEILLERDPDIESVILMLIENLKDEDALVKCLELCLDPKHSRSATFDQSIIFVAMENFPRSFRLIKTLLDNGCIAGGTKDVQFEGELTPESVTPLIWALYQPRGTISDAVIVELLNSGKEANPNYMTPQWRHCAIIKAVQDKRYDPIRKMMEQRVDVSVRDNKKHSALFYACQNSDLESVMLLVNAGARPQDGSLHEAAKRANPDIVSCLLACRHAAGYHSALHNGRTALQELCLNGATSGFNWETRVRKTMELLFAAGCETNDLTKDNKTVLHLAIDNEYNPLEMVEALMEMTAMWEGVEYSESHLYDDGKYIYSPPKYVEHLYTGSEGMKNQLIDLLETAGYPHRYYSDTGTQPEGAVGLPRDIQLLAKRQTRAEWELQQELDRQTRLAAHARELAIQDHKQRLVISNEEHEQSLGLLQDRETTGRAMAQKMHEMGMSHQRERSQYEQKMIEEKNQLLIMGESESAAKQNENNEARYTGEIEHRQRLIDQDRFAYEERAVKEKQLIAERDSVMKSQYDRRMELLERQDQNMRLKGWEMRSTVESYKGLSFRKNLLALDWHDTPN